VPGGIALLAAPAIRSRWLQALACVVVFFAGVKLDTTKQYNWVAYWRKATAGREVRWRQLDHQRNVSAFLGEHIPAGAMVLTDEETAMWIVMAHDCHVVLHQRIRHGIRDLDERKDDLQALLAADTPWENRQRLLRKYDIRYCAVTARTQDSFGWVKGRVKRHWQSLGYLILELNTD
jgi:hypothetical protein